MYRDTVPTIPREGKRKLVLATPATRDARRPAAKALALARHDDATTTMQPACGVRLIRLFTAGVAESVMAGRTATLAQEHELHAAFAGGGGTDPLTAPTAGDAERHSQIVQVRGAS